jgi:quinolinate synthase
MAVAASPPGSAWAIGTDLNLVHRLAHRAPDKTIAFLDRTICCCSTMNQIDLPHLTWALEELEAGRVPKPGHRGRGDQGDALVAPERMLALPVA